MRRSRNNQFAGGLIRVVVAVAVAVNCAIAIAVALYRIVAVPAYRAIIVAAAAAIAVALYRIVAVAVYRAMIVAAVATVAVALHRATIVAIALNGAFVVACAPASPTPAGSTSAGAGGTSPTASSCPTDRAIVLASRADIARAARCTTLAGVVVRSGAALDTSALSALTTITGDLVIGPTVGILEVSFRELRVVEGALRVRGNGLLQGVFLPRLERAGAIEIDGNVALTTISLPRLASVRGSFHVTDNASLELIDIATLQSIANDLVITGAPQLTLIEASQLNAAASVKLEASKLPPDIADRVRATAAP